MFPTQQYHKRSEDLATEAVDRALLPGRKGILADLGHQRGSRSRRGCFRLPKRDTYEPAAAVVYDACPFQSRLVPGDPAVSLHRVEYRFPVLRVRRMQRDDGEGHASIQTGAMPNGNDRPAVSMPILH
jgi:hypothetical protein